MSNQDMATNKVKNIAILSEGFDIFDENDFILNPYNKRDWDQYAVTAEWAEVDDESIVVEGDRYLKLSCENENVNYLLNALIFRNPENANDISIYVNNPILTTNKKVGEEIIGQPKYVVFAGNSRLALIQNINDAVVDLAADDPDFNLESVSLIIRKLNHEIDANIDGDKLLGEQIRDNTSVNLLPWQKAQLVGEYLENLRTENPDVKKGDLVARASSAFGVNFTQIYAYEAFNKLPEVIQELHTVHGVAMDTVRLIQQCYKALSKLGSNKSAMEVYNEIRELALVENNGNITRGVVEQYRKAQESILSPSDVPTETVESEDIAEDTEGTETAIDTDSKAPKTLKTQSAVSVDELKENHETLLTVGNDIHTMLVESIEEFDIANYDGPEAVKLLQAMDNLLDLVTRLDTAADKSAKELEKEKAKAEAKAAKEAAKAEAKAAEAEAEAEWEDESEPVDAEALEV